MKWKRASKSYVEDRRGAGGGGFGGFGRGGGGFGGGGGIPVPIPSGRGGLGGIGLLIVIAFIAFQMCSGGFGGGSGSPDGGLGGGGGLGGIQAQPDTGERGVPEGDTAAQFIEAVTQDVQETWQQAFRDAGREYRNATLVLFEEGVDTGCGPATSQVGPFYCPLDERIYIDLGFFEDLESRFGARGDFAPAYVVAHEFGHHVQNVLGISEQVRAEQQRNPGAANDLSIRQELQADCFAGVWAHSVWKNPDNEAVQQITQEDIREGIDAAAAVGDDRIQQSAGAEVNPETWTHGSSEQRMEWFERGFEKGSADACDTFSQ